MDERIDKRIAAVAKRQYRNVTRAQLLDLGLGGGAIIYRRRKGTLYEVYPGVYSLGAPPTTVLERAYAAILACGPDALLSHHAGLALWGFVKRWPSSFEITTPHNRRPRGITVHRSTTITARDRTRQLGIPVTTPARTILDCAPTLGRRLTRILDDALHGSFLTRNQLAEACRLHPIHPGTKLILPFTTTTDGPSRSGWEADFPAGCLAAGLPRPQINSTILGRERDAWFAAERVIVELDSWRFHNDRASFEADRERDAACLDHDILTVRITWDRHHGTPEREFARLERILARRRAEFDRG